MTEIVLTGEQFDQIRQTVENLLGLTLAQTFILASLLLFIVGAIFAGIFVSRWYK